MLAYVHSIRFDTLFLLAISDTVQYSSERIYLEIYYVITTYVEDVEQNSVSHTVELTVLSSLMQSCDPSPEDLAICVISYGNVVKLGDAYQNLDPPTHMPCVIQDRAPQEGPREPRSRFRPLHVRTPTR